MTDLQEQFDELIEAFEREEREIEAAERLLIDFAEKMEKRGAIKEGTAELLVSHFGFE